MVSIKLSRQPLPLTALTGNHLSQQQSHSQKGSARNCPTWWLHMVPAQRQTYESNSLRGCILTRQIFHFIFIYTFIPERVSLHCTDGPWRRDSPSPIHWVACQPPRPSLSLIPSLVPMKGWNFSLSKATIPWMRSRTTHNNHVWLTSLFGWFGGKENFWLAWFLNYK